ncbi:MAG: NAD(P)-dependent oxidoreductase [Clostridia bacterium]
MKTIKELDVFMCRPSSALIQDIRTMKGNVLVLGAGGKMGPTLCKLLANAVKEAGTSHQVTAVSRYTDDAVVKDLDDHGIHVIKADLLDDEALQRLPDVENVIYMAGRKFGTSEDASLTWAMNTYLPGRVALKYRNSRIVVFSSGNVYPFVPVTSGGATEHTMLDPVGDYAQSCVGRENIFRYFSNMHQTEILLFRLNYAIDLRYGILLEVAKAVKNSQPVDLSSGNVNVIWQGCANEYAIRSLLHCQYPAHILNVTGPETLSIRWIAHEFAKRFGTSPVFSGFEQASCLLSNASKAFHLFGYPTVTVREMMDLTCEWVLNQGITSDKPTHFQERKGQF